MAVDLVGPLLMEMLTCASGALDPPASRVALYPGAEVAYDECCDGGQVWVRLVGLVPTGSSSQVTQAQPCGVLMWQATVGVGALRCAAVVDDAGRAPSVAALNNDTALMTADQAALLEAIQCCMVTEKNRLRIVSWSPLGPEGGCVGGEWQVVLMVDNCPCSEAT